MRSCTLALSLAMLACVGHRAQAQNKLIVIHAVCSNEETSRIVAGAVSDFATGQRWDQANVSCDALDENVADALAASRPVLVLTTYDAAAGLRSLGILNPHLIAYPTYVVSTSPAALRASTLTVGYVGGPVHQSRLRSALSAALRNDTLTLRLFRDAVQLVAGLRDGQIQAIAVVGDDPGATLARTLDAFRPTSLSPSVMLLPVDKEEVGRIRPAFEGQADYLFWNWANRPVLLSLVVPATGGNAFVEIVRSFPTRLAMRRAVDANRFANAPPGDDLPPSTLKDMPVLLSTAEALTVETRADLGRVLSAAYLRAAYAVIDRGADSCAKDFAESVPATYLLNALLENQSDPAAACALWAHYTLTSGAAERRSNDLNAGWLRSTHGEMCRRISSASHAGGSPAVACNVPTAKKFALGDRAPYDYGLALLNRALTSKTTERVGILSQARSCFIEALSVKDEIDERRARIPTCQDPKYRRAYEPYLPFLISTTDNAPAPVRR